ncbi:MAG: HAD-IIB family hydrolase, partial [Acidimicrobiales bacterium]
MAETAQTIVLGTGSGRAHLLPTRPYALQVRLHVTTPEKSLDIVRKLDLELCTARKSTETCGSQLRHEEVVMPDHRIRLLLADVDGTLVTPDKVLTERAVAAVEDLHDAGILFAITSGRPPRGMSMLVEPLNLETPIAAFNGGLIVDRHLAVLEQRVVPSTLVPHIGDLLTCFGLDVWVYRGADWYVPDLDGSHVAREAQTVEFQAKVLTNLSEVTDEVAKIVGVSDDHEAVNRAAKAVQDRFGHEVTAEPSQPYYLDVTHPEANKGSVVDYLIRKLHVSSRQIATIG